MTTLRCSFMIHAALKVFQREVLQAVIEKVSAYDRVRNITFSNSV